MFIRNLSDEQNTVELQSLKCGDAFRFPRGLNRDFDDLVVIIVDNVRILPPLHTRCNDMYCRKCHFFMIECFILNKGHFATWCNTTRVCPVKIKSINYEDK